MQYIIEHTDENEQGEYKPTRIEVVGRGFIKTSSHYHNASMDRLGPDDSLLVYRAGAHRYDTPEAGQRITLLADTEVVISEWGNHEGLRVGIRRHGKLVATFQSNSAVEFYIAQN